VAENEALYRQGKVGDVAMKKELVRVLNKVIAPIRERRKTYEQRPDDVLDVLREGTKRANAVAEETLALAKKAMKQDYFGRTLTIR
jgi:tryptophanyl-tRNA synthetase